MITIQTYPANNLPQWAADQMTVLTKPGSLHSKWLTALAAGTPHPDMPEDLAFAVASRDQDFEITVIGWASLHCWLGAPALEAFVHPEERRQKIATALSICITLAENTPKLHIGVFSPECHRIGKHLGFKEVFHYKRVDDGWVVTPHE